MKKLFAILIAFHLMIMPMKAHAIGGMSQITGIAVAAVGVSLIGSCAFKPPSIMIYAAGAAAYLMGEMNAAKDHGKNTKDSEAEAEKLKNSGLKGGELQKAALEAQLKQKEEDLKLAKKRKMWGMAAAAIFIAAAAMAAMEIPPFVPPAGCTPNGLSLPLAAGVVGAYTFISGGSLMTALLGAAAGAATTMEAVKAQMNLGPTRAIAMGVTAGLVTLSAMDAGKSASKLEKEVADLKTMIAQFKSETDGTGPNTEDTTAGANGGADSGVAGGSTSGSTSGATGGTAITALPNGVQSNGTIKNCLSATQEIGTNCSNPMTFTAPNLNGLGNGPELQQVANQSAQFANAATSGDVGKADVAAASLASMAGRMSELLKKNQQAANKKLIAEGKKPIDYEKASQDMLKSMQSSYQKETASKQPQLAAFGLDKMNLDPAKADTSGQNITSASTSAVATIPTSKGDAAAAVAPEVPATDANAAAADASKNKNSESATDALGKNLDQYESSENDISKNSGESLWKQVSNRYLLNFDKIFDRKKPAEKPAQ